jgi:hypothetical protein
MSHPTLAQALPKLAAQIDTERPLIARAIADHVTVDLQTEIFKVVLHVSDPGSFQLLETTSQWTYLRDLFTAHGFGDYVLELTHASPPPVNTVPPVNEVPPSPSITTAPSPTPKPPRQMLNITQRSKLLTWLETNRALAELEPDNDLAITAYQALGFLINASHIRTLRTHLGIAKIKPEPLPADLSLADLQARLAAHEERLAAHAVQAAGMKATIAALHDRLRGIIAHLNADARFNGSADVEIVADLPPLNQSGQ